MGKKKLTQEQAIMEACDNDKDLALFFAEWLSNGKNGRQAYLKFHPNVDIYSAGVLASRQLAKVKLDAFLAVYNLGKDRYYKQLDEALEADKWNDFTGEREADHKTRLPYHTKLGNILGIEKKEDSSTKVQVNFQQFIQKEKNEFGI